MTEIKCIINGKPTAVTVEEGETVLEMLRERLGLTGVKKGCEVGECGACTVLLDGVPTATCLLLAPLADGKEILTIEGMSDGRRLSVLQQAFVDEGAVQCGFCTPGMILTAHALLQKNKRPSAADIKRELSGNICRCAAYEQITAAIQSAAKTLYPDL